MILKCFSTERKSTIWGKLYCAATNLIIIIMTILQSAPFSIHISQNVQSVEPAHEIMALFVLCKLILQTRMCSHPGGLDAWFLVRHFVYFHTSCVRTAKAPAKLRGCAGSPEPSPVAYVISTIISWAGSINSNHIQGKKLL